MKKAAVVLFFMMAGFLLMQVSAQDYLQDKIDLSREGGTTRGAGDKKEMISQIIDEYQEGRKMKPDIKEQIAHIFARNLSVKRNKRLSEPEIKALVNQLFACSQPAVSPSGKKCFITFNSADLEKQFS